MEDIDDYEAFEATVIADYDAESAVERELVLRIASVLWRLRRSTLIETGLFEIAVENLRGQEHEPSQTTLGESAEPSNHSKMFLRALSETDAAERTWSRIQFKKGYRPLLLVPGRSTEKCSRSSEPLRTDAMAASPTTYSHARLTAAPQATAASLGLSIFTPITARSSTRVLALLINPRAQKYPTRMQAIDSECLPGRPLP